MCRFNIACPAGMAGHTSEECLDLFRCYRRELVLGHLEVAWLSHVQPGFVHGIHDRACCLLLKPAENGRHIAMLAGAQDVERGGLEGVDSGIDMAASDGLFFEAYDVHAPSANHTKRMLPLV